MIKSFKLQRLAEYFNMGRHRKIRAKHAAHLILILALLRAATHAGAMNAPGLGFHPLKGKPKRWAVSAYQSCRVIIRCEDGHTLEVDNDDYQ